MAMSEAAYYDRLDDDVIKCRLCPHECLMRPGKAGVCRVRKNVDGRLITANYARASSLAMDPIEKKPLYHFYPGSFILSVGTVGCNFRCDFCQNWTIAQQEAHTEELSADELIGIAKKEGSIGIAYTYNEPSVWYEFVLECARKAKASGLANVLVTNGFINREPAKELLPYIDAMNIDVKSFQEEYYRRVCKGERDAVLRMVELASAYVHVEVTTLVVTGLNDSDDEMERLSKWLASVDKEIPLHLSRYFPNYKMTRPPTPVDTLYRLRDIARRYLSYVYLGNVAGSDNNTYCPQCQNLLIRRHYNGSTVGIEDGRCKNCGFEIKGVF